MSANAKLDKGIVNWFQAVELGSPVSQKGLTVFPLLSHASVSLDYIGLSQALAEGTLSVSELDKNPSVSRLLVDNRGPLPVLMLDGEELEGGKQNRVMNTTILFPAETTGPVPVSCTEQGRWSNQAHPVSSETIVMNHRGRCRKSVSVSENLNTVNSYASDQQAVWEEVECLHQDVGTHSHTGAMRDAFRVHEDLLGRLTETATCCEGQMGLLVLLNGHPLGLDMISNPKVYRHYHQKLLFSYATAALELMLKDRLEVPETEKCLCKAAWAFLDRAQKMEAVEHPSMGMGCDVRLSATHLAGSALRVEQTYVHTTVFDTAKTKSTTMNTTGRLYRHFRDEEEVEW